MLEALPFDQYQRYGALRLVADRLRDRLGRPLRILDVGDWSGLGTRFCPDDLTIWLDPTGAGAGRYVQADGAHLPVGDRAFDLVACVDTLEHVEPAARPRVVAELHRAAGAVVVVAVPIADDGAAVAERALYDYVWDVLGGEQQQLREHAERGLPTRAEARSWFAAVGWAVAEAPSGLLTDWLAMMVAKHALIGVPDAENAHQALDRRYNRRHGAVDPAEPAYRQVLVSARAPFDDLPSAVVGTLRPVRHAGDVEDTRAAATLLLGAHARRAGAALDLCELVDPDPVRLALASRALDRAVREGRARADAVHARIAVAQAEIEAERTRAGALAERVRAFEAGRFVRAMAALGRLRAGLRR